MPHEARRATSLSPITHALESALEVAYRVTYGEFMPREMGISWVRMEQLCKEQKIVYSRTVTFNVAGPKGYCLVYVANS